MRHLSVCVLCPMELLFAFKADMSESILEIRPAAAVDPEISTPSIGGAKMEQRSKILDPPATTYISLCMYWQIISIV